VASAIPALQEIGGAAAAYCAVGNISEWANTVVTLLHEKETDVPAWRARTRAGAAAAARFDWKAYAHSMARLYCDVAAASPADTARTRAS
jgi:hypothetical protein